MAKESAGILLYRKNGGELQVLLAHPGGPFWATKDAHAWSIPKGEIVPGESPLQAAVRELGEETGAIVHGETLPLGQVKQASGKLVHAWAVEQDFDPNHLQSNLFELAWPPKSGHVRTFPEVDRVAWFTVQEAELKMLSAQWPFVERLAALLKQRPEL